MKVEKINKEQPKSMPSAMHGAIPETIGGIMEQFIANAKKVQLKAQEDEVKRLLQAQGYSVYKKSKFIKFLAYRCQRSVEQRGETTYYTLIVDQKPLIVWNDAINIQTEGTKIKLSFTKPTLL